MKKRTTYKVLSAVAALLVAAAAVMMFVDDPLPKVRETPEGTVIIAKNTAQIQRYFKSVGYDMLPHLKEKKPVPRLFVQSVPSDFNKEKYDEVRPALFYEMMLPLILKANETLAAEREQVVTLKKEFDQNGDLTPESMEKLKEWITRYDVKLSDDLGTLFDTLLPKVDAVTPTLMLAMAAEDSGFGTSRYAREYNSVFHERDWDGNGIVPDEKQKEGPQYRIKVFPSLYEAVLSRMRYLNTNGYFGNYRIARARYRRTDNLMRGYSVAHLLINFPYKTIKYPDIIKHLIVQYELTPLDSQKLEPAGSGGEAKVSE